MSFSCSLFIGVFMHCYDNGLPRKEASASTIHISQDHTHEGTLHSTMYVSSIKPVKGIQVRQIIYQRSSWKGVWNVLIVP